MKLSGQILKHTEDELDAIIDSLPPEWRVAARQYLAAYAEETSTEARVKIQQRTVDAALRSGDAMDLCEETEMTLTRLWGEPPGGVWQTSDGFSRRRVDGTFTYKLLDPEGFDTSGYKDGYNRDGFDRSGFNRDGFNKDGVNSAGLDQDGYDKEGFNQDGYNRDGVDRDGHDAYRFNLQGFDRDGFDRDGFDREGYDRDGYSRYGGLDRAGYNREGFDQYGYNRQGYNAAGLFKYRFSEEGWDLDGYNNRGRDENSNSREANAVSGHTPRRAWKPTPMPQAPSTDA